MSANSGGMIQTCVSSGHKKQPSLCGSFMISGRSRKLIKTTLRVDNKHYAYFNSHQCEEIAFHFLVYKVDDCAKDGGKKCFYQDHPGGGSSIVKVPGDVPPARVYFFKLSSLAKCILLPILVHLVWARVCFLTISVKEMSNFGNSCKETQLFSNFGPENAKIWQFLSRKCQLI